MPKRKKILVVSDQQLMAKFKFLFRYGFDIFFVSPREAFSFFLDSEIDFVFILINDGLKELEKNERVFRDIEFFAGEDVKIFRLGFMKNEQILKDNYIEIPFNRQKVLSIVM